MTRREEAASSSLSLLEYAVLWIAFGAITVGSVHLFAEPSLRLGFLAALAVGTGAFVSALLWFFLLALRRSTSYAVAMLIPYVNLIAALRFSRRYWSEGAWRPAALAAAGMALQLAGSLGLLFPRSAVLL